MFMVDKVLCVIQTAIYQSNSHDEISEHQANGTTLELYNYCNCRIGSKE